MICPHCNGFTFDNCQFCSACGRLLATQQSKQQYSSSFYESLKQEACVTNDEILKKCYAVINEDLDRKTDEICSSIKNNIMINVKKNNYQYTNGFRTVCGTYLMPIYQSREIYTISKEYLETVIFPKNSNLGIIHNFDEDIGHTYEWTATFLEKVQETNYYQIHKITPLGERIINTIKNKLQPDRIEIYDTVIYYKIGGNRTIGNFWTGKRTEAYDREAFVHSGEAVQLGYDDRYCSPWGILLYYVIYF